MHNFLAYLLTCALITYLLRVIPLILFKEKITNKFVLSFLYYLPYSVLTIMTIPAIFTSTSHASSAIAGFIVALIASYKGNSLLKVIIYTCLAALLMEIILFLF